MHRPPRADQVGSGVSVIPEAALLSDEFLASLQTTDEALLYLALKQITWIAG